MKTIERKYVYTGLFIVLFVIADCSDHSDEVCTCTAMECINGISVFVRRDDGGTFPQGNYTLQWKLGIFAGEVGPDSLWHWDASKKDSLVVFYIDNNAPEGRQTLSEQEDSLILQFYINDTKTAEAQSFKPNWITRICNYCTGPCEDLVTNADIEMAVSLQTLSGVR